MRARTCVSVVVFIARKLRPCPSYSRRRDRNNSVHWRSLYKGGAGYFTKDMLMTVLSQGIGSPNTLQNLKRRPAPKPAPKGKHVQLFKMRRKVGKGFYSTAPDAPDGQ